MYSQQEVGMPRSRNREVKRTEKNDHLATLLTVVCWATKEPGPLTVFENVHSRCFLIEEGRCGRRKVHQK